MRAQKLYKKKKKKPFFLWPHPVFSLRVFVLCVLCLRSRKKKTERRRRENISNQKKKNKLRSRHAPLLPLLFFLRCHDQFDSFPIKSSLLSFHSFAKEEDNKLRETQRNRQKNRFLFCRFISFLNDYLIVKPQATTTTAFSILALILCSKIENWLCSVAAAARRRR